MSFRNLPGDDADQVRAWMQSVVTAIDALQRQQPAFGPSIQIGDLRLDAVTVGTVVHLYATNTLTGATALIV
jgi:hypothetical protein